MLPHPALCIDAAQPRAGVNTPPADAGPVSWAVCVHFALGPTVGRGAQHVGQALALTLLPILSRWGGVGAAEIRVAGVLFSYIRSNC